MTASPTVEFRYATQSDTESIVRLVESAYRGESSRAGWTTEADLLGGQRTCALEVEELIAEPESRILLATRSERLVGCVLLRREPGFVYVGMVAVRPRLQGEGLGRLLLAEGERRARCDFGLLRTRMTVIEQREELIAWYQRRGYVLTSETEPFPYGDSRFGLPKRDDLRFVVLEKPLA